MKAKLKFNIPKVDDYKFIVITIQYGEHHDIWMYRDRKEMISDMTEAVMLSSYQVVVIFERQEKGRHRKGKFEDIGENQRDNIIQEAWAILKNVNKF